MSMVGEHCVSEGSGALVTPNPSFKRTAPTPARWFGFAGAVWRRVRRLTLR